MRYCRRVLNYGDAPDPRSRCSCSLWRTHPSLQLISDVLTWYHMTDCLLWQFLKTLKNLENLYMSYIFFINDTEACLLLCHISRSLCTVFGSCFFLWVALAAQQLVIFVVSNLILMAGFDARSLLTGGTSRLSKNDAFLTEGSANFWLDGCCTYNLSLLNIKRRVTWIYYSKLSPICDILFASLFVFATFLEQPNTMVVWQPPLPCPGPA